MKAFKGKYINLSKIEQELIWGKQQTAKKKKKKSEKRSGKKILGGNGSFKRPIHTSGNLEGHLHA